MLPGRATVVLLAGLVHSVEKRRNCGHSLIIFLLHFEVFVRQSCSSFEKTFVTLAAKVCFIQISIQLLEILKNYQFVGVFFG